MSPTGTDPPVPGDGPGLAHESRVVETPARQILRIGILSALLMATVGCFADERLRRAEEEARMVQCYPAALLANIDRPDTNLWPLNQP